MTNLVQSLFRIDPTEGLYQYAQAVKPFHSKVLDVLVEYVYKENVNVRVKDKWSWVMQFSRPDVDVERTCGYGLVWDPYPSNAAIPPVVIISAQSSQSIPVTVRSTPDPTILSISANGYTLPAGLIVTVSTTGELPASIPQLTIGTEYATQGHNGAFQLIDPTTLTPVSIQTNGVGTLHIEPRATVEQPSGDKTELPFNSFLVDPLYGDEYDIAVINKKSNQFAFVKTHTINNISTGLKQIRIVGDIRPTIPIVSVQYDSNTVVPLNNSGNCRLIIRGNYESYFPPGSTFTVVGSSNSNGTFTVADTESSRLLTKFDGLNTSIPIDESISLVADGNAQINMTTYLAPGSTIYVNNNIDAGTNRAYTVSQAVVASGYTTITVNEAISLLAQNNGHVNIPLLHSSIPAWATGTRIKVKASGPLPTPLSELTSYHYVSTANPGIFNLAHKRYPSAFSDYVNVNSTNVINFRIVRDEVFNPGAYVKVSGSYMNKNDGLFIVRKTKNEGTYVRVYVLEKVRGTTPQNVAHDGMMQINNDSFDMPPYCVASQAPDMFADTFIHEHLSFEYSMHFTDMTTSIVSELSYTGYGDTPFSQSPYATGVGDYSRIRSVSEGTPASPTGFMLPHGYDIQLFDVGGMYETIESNKQIRG